MIFDIASLCVLLILVYLLGFDNAASTKGCIRCRIAGHKYGQGVPAEKPERFVAWLFCYRCGHAVSVVNAPPLEAK